MTKGNPPCAPAVDRLVRRPAGLLRHAGACRRQGAEYLQLVGLHRPRDGENFEKETGIQVRYDVYDSNEVLQAKVLTGRSGLRYRGADQRLLAKQLQANIYQPIDKNKLSNYKTWTLPC